MSAEVKRCGGPARCRWCGEPIFWDEADLWVHDPPREFSEVGHVAAPEVTR